MRSTLGHNIIRLFTAVFTNVSNKLECLLDKAVKAYQGQTLCLTVKIRKSLTKKFYSIGPRVQFYKTFYRRNLQMFVSSQSVS